MNVVRAPWIVVAVACIASWGHVTAAADQPAAAVTFPAFLAEKGIDRANRTAIVEAAEWNDAVQQAVVRVLLRLAAPGELVRQWHDDAVDLGDEPPVVDDRLVAVRGRAVFVAPHRLTPEQQELAAGRTHFDLVRIVDDQGAAADVLVWQAPKAWPRGRTIDEPAVAFGLPLSTKIGPRPDGWQADGAPTLVLAAPAVSWFPTTPLGSLGMDYALFDKVVDGTRLESGDSEAFFAMLAAAKAMPETAAGKPTDVVPLIDPSQKWFATHRGEEVVIAGDVRRATRIAIDEPARREQVGGDHYWELFVFAPTPPLSVNGNLQDSFPIVCCVRELPAGMPTGDQISESVVVKGFAMKRYAYPLVDAVIGEEVRKDARRETPLVIGRRATWQPRPSTTGASNLLFAAFASLAGLVAGALAWGAWSMRRDARQAEARARAELPQTFTLPEDRH